MLLTLNVFIFLEAWKKQIRIVRTLLVSCAVLGCTYCKSTKSETLRFRDYMERLFVSGVDMQSPAVGVECLGFAGIVIQSYALITVGFQQPYQFLIGHNLSVFGLSNRFYRPGFHHRRTDFGFQCRMIFFLDP